MGEGVRIDKWLWAARFYKTRSLARSAINGGKVRLNGLRVKPGKPLTAGDRLSIQRGEEQFDVAVAVLSQRRGPASEAQEMYQETGQSVLRRQAHKEQRALQRAARAERERRPDKRQRRQIMRFRKKSD
ncbi:MAG: RNA-binding protein [Gammaproteobacteria bacterium]|nr:RNA-binding protein [Gammaproteobacteria bacterium]NNE05938.1 RNA-binding protein [Xanthomonadales bacterium]